MSECFIGFLEEKNIEPRSTHRFVYGIYNSIKFEWWEKQKKIHLGWTNSEEERDKIYSSLVQISQEFDSLSIYQQDSLVILETNLEEDNLNKVIWEKVHSILGKIVFDEVNIYNSKNLGPNFSDTIFENLKERGTTISPMFCKMVCRESGMKLENMLAEYYIDGGRIDGVELDESGNIISIYECGSGIHKGMFLDWDHWNKILCRYLYSDNIWSDHLKRIVLLAGGYSGEILSLSKNAFKLFKKAGIELVLLKTIKENNKIDIAKINLQ